MILYYSDGHLYNLSTVAIRNCTSMIVDSLDGHSSSSSVPSWPCGAAASDRESSMENDTENNTTISYEESV